MRARLMRQDGVTPFHRFERDALVGRTVLQIIPQLDAGGAERTTIDVAAALIDAGARALVASEGGRLVPELQAKGGLWIPFPAATKNPLSMALNTRRLAALMRAEGVDIIHARSRAPAWVALGAARATKTPFVTTYHGAYAGKSKIKLSYNSVMARGDAVIANSNYTARAIRALYPQAEGRIRVIHRGTDFRRFAPEAVDPERVRKLRQSWGAAPDERIVLLAARLTGWKGQRVLIEAARLMRDRGLTGVLFALVGDPQGRTGYVKELEAQIAAAKLENMVRIHDHCSDMPAALMAAAVAVVASTEPEAFGRVAVEAQAVGAPVIVSDLGAVPETVLAPPDVAPAEATGWRVPAGDPVALATALAEALNLGATARDALSLRARAHVRRNFSLEKMCAETLDVYERLLAAPRA
jgi:glycosyltransferase involved in cell wall biosynthesis